MNLYTDEIIAALAFIVSFGILLYVFIVAMNRYYKVNLLLTEKLIITSHILFSAQLSP